MMWKHGREKRKEKKRKEKKRKEKKRKDLPSNGNISSAQFKFPIIDIMRKMI